MSSDQDPQPCDRVPLAEMLAELSRRPCGCRDDGRLCAQHWSQLKPWQRAEQADRRPLDPG